jgi:hypothetical protein
LENRECIGYFSAALTSTLPIINPFLTLMNKALFTKSTVSRQATQWLVGAFSLLLPLLSWGQGSSTIVISQLYGGGGNSGAIYKNDFVELHNVSAGAVTITGYVLQYASASNAFAAPSTTNSITLNGSIPAGGYYLVGLAGGTTGSALPTPDQSNTNVNLSATSGKVVLASSNSTSGITPASANTIDFVGYGTANSYEGAAAAPSSSGNVFAIVRGPSGCTDTNQNGSDFSVATTFTPRNSSSPTAACSATAPAIGTAPTATFTAFSTPAGTPSAAQTYALAGSNLTADVTVTAPSGYEVAQSAASSTTLPGTYAATQTVAMSGGSASATIYVRLTGTTAGAYAGNVTNVSGPASANVAVTGNTTGLTVSPTSLSGFSTTQGTASTPAQSYTLTGAGLTGSVTVTPPAGYQVSQTSATTGFAADGVAITISQTNATAGRTIYVRLSAAAVAGTVAGDITNATAGGPTQRVAVTGTVAAPAPVLTASRTTLPAFNAAAGAPSASQAYTLTGANLAGDITVTAPSGFEVSLTGTAGPYAGTATAPAANVQATSGQTIYVRLNSTTAGTPSGNVTNAGGGATTQSVAVTGTVVADPNASPAPTVAAGTPTTSSVVLTLGAGAGTNLLVVVRPSTATATAPADGTAYAGATAYGTGTALGSGFVVFAAANAASVTVTGLPSTSSYVADVYTYNVGTAAGGENYGPASGSSSTFTTATPPPSAPGLLLLEEDFDYPSGTALVAQTASTGWQRIASNGSNFPVTTASDNQTRFTYPQGASFATVQPSGFTASSQASLAGGSSAEDIYKAFLTAQPSGTTTLYAAALVNLSSVTGSGAEYFLSFSNITSSSTISIGRVFAQAAASGGASGYRLGITGNNGTATSGNFASTILSFNTTYVVVAKVDNSSGTDQASLYIFDNSSTTALPLAEPATPSAGPVNSGSAVSQLAGITSFQLRQASGSFPNLTLDNLRVATGWGAVVGQPVLTAGSTTLGAGNYYGVRVSGTGMRVTTTGPVAIEKTLDLDGGVLVTSAANPVVLRYRAPATPPDDFQVLVAAGGTSYVDGPVSREVAAGAGPSQLFPIGRNGNYRPLTLNIDIAPNAATLYTASQTEGTPADQTLTSPLVRISRVRYYTLTPSPVPAAGTFSGSVELSFGNDDGVTDPSAADLVVAKNSNDGTHWTSISRQSNTGIALKSGSFQSFSDFILANTDPTIAANPLPVQLTSFSAARTAGGVQLAWATASEINSQRFEVERSADGRTYARVATLAAQGSTTLAHRYATLDAAAPAGQLYYRLRQVDLDGKARYSPAVAVAGPATEFALAPNPARESLHLLTEQPTAYLVRTALGQVALQGTTATGTTTVPVGHLAPGVYFFELHAGSGRVVRRFVKE